MLESTPDRVVGGTCEFLICDQVYDGRLLDTGFTKDYNVWRKGVYRLCKGVQ